MFAVINDITSKEGGIVVIPNSWLNCDKTSVS